MWHGTSTSCKVNPATNTSTTTTIALPCNHLFNFCRNRLVTNAVPLASTTLTRARARVLIVIQLRNTAKDFLRRVEPTRAALVRKSKLYPFLARKSAHSTPDRPGPAPTANLPSSPPSTTCSYYRDGLDCVSCNGLDAEWCVPPGLQF